jgi:Xaa-Pro aminopeptidase
MQPITTEKVQQAISILNELGIDAWLTFVRETIEMGDPILPLVLGQHLTWQSALILTRSGDRIAIVGRYDDEAVRSTGVWTDVQSYVQAIRDPLVETLTRIDPGRLAINFSKDDLVADGLSHGMYLLLQDYLADTPYQARLVGADAIIGALRGRKSPGEIERVRAAIASTQEILESVSGFATPGKTEREVAAFVKDSVQRRNLGLAWDAAKCPIVNTGPESMVGHGIPSDLVIEPGHVLHLDFGVKQDDYCADLQRCWYVPRSDETSPPNPVRRAFDTVRQAIEAAAATLQPGVEGWQVDQAARSVVTGAGYPEYQHATGHTVGRSAHDGGGILGPKWERYGQTPFRKAEVGNVFTLELGIENIDGGAGYLGLEEMVVVTDEGCEYLSTPQRTLPLLGR